MNIFDDFRRLPRKLAIYDKYNNKTYVRSVCSYSEWEYIVDLYEAESMRHNELAKTRNIDFILPERRYSLIIGLDK